MALPALIIGVLRLAPIIIKVAPKVMKRLKEALKKKPNKDSKPEKCQDCKKPADPKAADRYRNNPNQLTGRKLDDLQKEFDRTLRDEGGWTKEPLKKGDGVRYTDGKGNGVFMNRGYPGAKDPLHGGPYVKIEPGGIRVPLSGNPTLPGS
jgi:hypothetical protein